MCAESLQSCLTLCDPMDYTVYGILQARILEWVVFPFYTGSSQPRVWTQSPTLQVDSLPAEPPGKPKNTGVDSLSLLQQIFSTQESNQGLLHCRRILYQLSYQGSLFIIIPPLIHLHLNIHEFSLGDDNSPIAILGWVIFLVPVLGRSQANGLVLTFRGC